MCLIIKASLLHNNKSNKSKGLYSFNFHHFYVVDLFLLFLSAKGRVLYDPVFTASEGSYVLLHLINLVLNQSKCHFYVS